jgi:hypothetical protein
MKKVLLLVLALSLLISQSVYCQTEKGKCLFGVASTINVGGGLGSEMFGLGFASTKYGEDSDPYKSTSFNFIPRAGVFVIDNLAVGVDIIVALWSEKGGDDQKYSNNTLAGGPFLRYYHPFSDKIKGVAEASAAFGSCKTLDDYGTSEFEEKFGLWTAGLGAGAAFFLCPCVSFDLMAGYSHVVWNEKDVEYEYKEVGNGFGIKIGISVYLDLSK